MSQKTSSKMIKCIQFKNMISSFYACGSSWQKVYNSTQHTQLYSFCLTYNVKLQKKKQNYCWQVDRFIKYNIITCLFCAWTNYSSLFGTVDVAYKVLHMQIHSATQHWTLVIAFERTALPLITNEKNHANKLLSLQKQDYEYAVHMYILCEKCG